MVSADLDGLRGLLFPGLRLLGQNNWLVAISLQCTGYARSASDPVVDAAYAQLIAPARRRKAKGLAELANDLRDAGEDIGAAILRLRMLQARLGGLANTVTRSTSAAPDTTSAAAVALAVATAILGTIDAEMKRVE